MFTFGPQQCGWWRPVTSAVGAVTFQPTAVLTRAPRLFTWRASRVAVFTFRVQRATRTGRSVLAARPTLGPPKCRVALCRKSLGHKTL